MTTSIYRWFPIFVPYLSHLFHYFTMISPMFDYRRGFLATRNEEDDSRGAICAESCLAAYGFPRMDWQQFPSTDGYHKHRDFGATIYKGNWSEFILGAELCNKRSSGITGLQRIYCTPPGTWDLQTAVHTVVLWKSLESQRIYIYRHSEYREIHLSVIFC